MQAIRERAGEPIAIVTPNRPQALRAEALVGAGDYVFGRAGSPSETRPSTLGVTCAVFLRRDGITRTALWSVTPLGSCEEPRAVPAPRAPKAKPPPLEPRPPLFQALASYHRHTRTAEAGLLLLPVGVVAVFAGGEAAQNHGWALPSGALVVGGTVTLVVAPGLLAGGSLGAANDLRDMGVDVSRENGRTASVFYAITLGSPLTVVGAVFLFPIGYIGTLVTGCFQMDANSHAFQASGLRASLRPIVTPNQRGLALVGSF